MPKNKFGTSRGWYHESKRHSLARQGIQTGRKANMKRRWDHEKSYFSQEKFDTLSRNQQKGTIIDIAKKAYAGVSNAIKWENEHYNKQKQWVKDEYNEAKNAIKHTHDNLKKGETAQSDKPWLQDYINESDGDAKKFVEQLKKYTPTEIDKKEVEDEKDHNEEGTPDITDKTLNANHKTRRRPTRRRKPRSILRSHTRRTLNQNAHQFHRRKQIRKRTIQTMGRKTKNLGEKTNSRKKTRRKKTGIQKRTLRTKEKIRTQRPIRILKKKWQEEKTKFGQ